MEPEKESASPPRISLWPLALLGTLLFASLSPKRYQSRKSVHPQDSTATKNENTPRVTTLVSHSGPTKPDTSNPDGSKKRTPFWEKAAVVVALGLLIVNILQMRSTEKAANAAVGAATTAHDTLELNKKMFSASQVAAFDCRAGIAAGAATAPYFEVICSNEGNIPARDVVGEFTFTRQTLTGKIAYSESRRVERRIVPKGGSIDQLFHVDVPYDTDVLGRYDFSIKGAITYDSGLAVTAQPVCWELIVNMTLKTTTWTDCANAVDLKKYPR